MVDVASEAMFLPQSLSVNGVLHMEFDALELACTGLPEWKRFESMLQGVTQVMTRRKYRDRFVTVSMQSATSLEHLTFPKFPGQAHRLAVGNPGDCLCRRTLLVGHLHPLLLCLRLQVLERGCTLCTACQRGRRCPAQLIPAVPPGCGAPIQAGRRVCPVVQGVLMPRPQSD